MISLENQWPLSNGPNQKVDKAFLLEEVQMSQSLPTSKEFFLNSRMSSFQEVSKLLSLENKDNNWTEE